MLTPIDLAVSIAEADIYAASRGLADWTGDNSSKTAALWRGQDYIAGKYNQRWMVTFDNATAPTEVKYAIVEAAVREIKAPFSLAPVSNAGTDKVLTEVEGIKFTLVGEPKSAEDMRPVLSSVEYLLNGIANIGLMPGHLVV